MAKGRLLANVGVKAKEGELVYYKDGKLYAVKAKRGGTKGRKSCAVGKKKKAAKKAAPRKKATARKKAAAPKKKVASRKKSAPKKSAAKKKPTAKKKATQLKFW
jgi:hypothetical protein